MNREIALLAANVDGRGRHRRAALRERIDTVVRTLGDDPSTERGTGPRLSRLADMLADPDPQRMWLALAVLNGRLPHSPTVERAVRTAALRGPLAALTTTLTGARPGWPWARGGWPAVEVVTGRVLVDLQHTAQTDLATGIQRVAREAASRWARDHDPLLVGWTPRMTGLRALNAAERERALHGTSTAPPSGVERLSTVVPWQCTYVLPELLTEGDRARALQALLRFSGTRGSMIGFDCVPISSGDTSAFGMGAGFSLMLSAAAYLDRIATISAGAATEYRGWRTMLAGAGMRGPQIAPIRLAVQAGEPGAAALAEAAELMLPDDLPMVLVVGSHEPRKNHLAVLHATELLWRAGHRFSVTFVGGNAWSSEKFTARLMQLRRAGRPIQSISALSDDLLWAAYRLARCVVFPSLNEGYGLPVAESLASGTPVITSDFGSMREIAAAGGGALLVDPRSDAELTGAMRSLLTDDALHARLGAQASAFPTRSWDEYAAETWAYLTASTTEPVAAGEARLPGDPAPRATLEGMPHCPGPARAEGR